MRQHRPRPRWWFIVTPLLMALLTVAGASAQTLGTASKAPRKRARTLGDIAGWIVLNNPSGSTHQPIVISDTNITDTARRGVISEGTPAWKPSREQQEKQRQAALSSQQAWQERLDRQQHDYEQAQQRLQRIDNWSSQRQEAYPGQSSPHNRPGGVASQSQLQREQAARELAEARAQLNRTRRAARREGHRFD